jgi:hypothetical protein
MVCVCVCMRVCVCVDKHVDPYLAQRLYIHVHVH